MATIGIRFGAAMGAGAPVYAPVSRLTQAITSSATSQASSAAKAGEYARVSVSGGAIWAAVSQTAAAGTGFLIPDGASIDVGPLKDGDTINVINA